MFQPLLPFLLYLWKTFPLVWKNHGKNVIILKIQNQNEAMYIACQMERGAVKHYARAMQLMQTMGREKEPLYASLEAMLHEEESHLEQFCALTDSESISPERQTLLNALMQDWLFKGGLMGAAREGMMEDIPSMLQYAQASEELSAAKYRKFALMTDDEAARQALLNIAAEEDKHYMELNTSSDNA